MKVGNPEVLGEPMLSFGAALGDQLAGLSGRYSIELPRGLEGELVKLVARSSALGGPNRAILIGGPEDYPTADSLNVQVVPPQDVLRYRDGEDRVFCWIRGGWDPDASFRTAVREYIGRLFPAQDDSLFDIDHIPTLFTCGLQVEMELCDERTLRSFQKAAAWLFHVISQQCQYAPTHPEEHWSDRTLEIWSVTTNDFHQSVSSAELSVAELEPRHAWELVRLAGIPIFEHEQGTNEPANGAPQLEIGQPVTKYVLSRWQEIAATYLTDADSFRELLLALDAELAEAGRQNSWRGFAMSSLEGNLPPTGSELGRLLFGQSGAGSLLQAGPSPYEALTARDWWGVTLENCVAATEKLREAASLYPVANSRNFVPFGEPTPTYLLTTREAMAEVTSSGNKWKSELRIRGVRFAMSGPWRRLWISHGEPAATPTTGDLWVKPGSIELNVRGRGVDVVPGSVKLSKDANDTLFLSFDLHVAYTATETEDGLSGSWNPDTRLYADLHGHAPTPDGWTSPRSIAASFKFVVPSPFDVTLLLRPSHSKGKVLIFPSTAESFQSSDPDEGRWIPQATPSVTLPRPGRYDCACYMGTLSAQTGSFLASATVTAGRQALEASETFEGLSSATIPLDDGTTLGLTRDGIEWQVLTFAVGDDSEPVSSAVRAALKGIPEATADPSRSSRGTALGKYQDLLLDGLSLHLKNGNPFESFFQLVVPASERRLDWPSFSPLEALPHFAGELLGVSGSGAGPSTWLRSTDQWRALSNCFLDVANELRVGQLTWLSQANPATVSLRTVRSLVSAHANLIRVAKDEAGANRDSSKVADVFWASFPFSMMVVDDTSPLRGRLRSVLLSPMHPVRLAWTYGALSVMEELRGHPDLLGLIEGWNFPFASQLRGPAGSELQLVAAPIDAGVDLDFVAWSGLGTIEQGFYRLPTVAAGRPIPWGGQTGINRRVVEQALGDFLRVHPEATSLEVDLAAVSPSPRSSEVDEAVIGSLGPDTLLDNHQIAGGVRVWDSEYRLGRLPVREAVLSNRTEVYSSSVFEWRAYDPNGEEGASLRTSDVRIIENSSPHLYCQNDGGMGELGPIPFRRFAPITLADDGMRSCFSVGEVSDVLQLGGLLREIEVPLGAEGRALTTVAGQGVLGLSRGASWQVLGPFFLEPAQLAALARSDGNAQILWDWRPSWLSRGRGESLERRSYFVIARVPASLTTALEKRYNLTPSQVEFLLGELGEKGIGLAGLHGHGATQSSAALGFFYALRLIGNSILTARKGSEGDSRVKVAGVLPVDPVYSLVRALASDPNASGEPDQRADLLMIEAETSDTDALEISLVPVEIKHHGRPGEAARWPRPEDAELKRARTQLEQTNRTLEKISENLATEGDDSTTAVVLAVRRTGLAALLELMLTLLPERTSPQLQQTLIRGALAGDLRISFGRSLILWFAPGAAEHDDRPVKVELDEAEGIAVVQVDPDRVSGLIWPGGAGEATDLFSELASWLFDSSSDEPISIRSHDNRPLADVLGGRGDGVTGGGLASDDARKHGAAVDQQENTTAKSEDLAESTSATTDSEVLRADEVADHASVDLPSVFIGSVGTPVRWQTIGKLADTNELVALDLEEPKAMGVFGYMGSGKSYLVNALIEGAVEEIPRLNSLRAPLATVVFNYRQIPTDRFELASLSEPNDGEAEVQRLKTEYGVRPTGIDRVRILCLPGELSGERQLDYGDLAASELFFRPEDLTVEDWELLMGQPNAKSVYAHGIRNALARLHQGNSDVSLDGLREEIEASNLSAGSKSAAHVRMDFVDRYLSSERGVDFRSVVEPGWVTVFDLRGSLFSKDDALRFFLVCTNAISKIQSKFNKLIVFDEAHEYMSSAFGEKMESRIRLMRHEGTSYLFATQDVNSIPPSIRRFLATQLVFDLGTSQNIKDLKRNDPEFTALADQAFLALSPGSCLVKASKSTSGVFRTPREIRVRPRVSRHGGRSRVFLEEQDD